MGVELITVSCDTQYVHLAWRTVEQELAAVQYQMGADPAGKLARMFGVYLEEAGVALRGAFIINPQGVLISAEIASLNIGRNIDELMRKFKASLYVSRKTAEACPAKWKDDGDVTLTPSAMMVGKVHEALEKGGKL
jgi:peroxiredoxin (alkyl hydroperoxide reductase subunit C)